MGSGGPFAQYKGKNVQRTANNLVLRLPLSCGFDEMAKRAEGYSDASACYAIDEYKGDTKAGKYQLIIADGETREPVDILPNRRKKTVANISASTGKTLKLSLWI